jgi:hypothetical protein
MQALRGRVVIAPTHFCLGTRLGEWSASRPGSAFSPVMETRAGLDTQAKGKILCLSRESNPGRLVCTVTRNTD